MIFFAALIALLTAVLWGAADFVSRKPSTSIGYYSTGLYVHLFGFIGLCVFFFATSSPLHLSFLGENPGLLALNLLVGILAFGAGIFIYRGYLVGTMSIVAPILSSYPIFTIALSVLLLGLVVALPVALGISIVIVGMILSAIKLSQLKNLRRSADNKVIASDQRHISPAANFVQGGSKKIVRGVDMAVPGFFLLGSIYFVLAIVTRAFGYLFPIVMMRGVGAICTVGLSIPLGQKLKLPRGRTLVWVILLSVFDTLAFVLYNYAVVLAQASLPIIVTLSAQFSAITVILARAFYKEKLEAIQYVGIALILVGIGVTLYF
jgi:drug/metabolite transporter (DMT)-like permease